MVKVVLVKKGNKHPPGVGRYLSRYSFEEVKKRLMEDYALHMMISKKEMFLDHVAHGGHILGQDAAILTWVDEENEFGPISP